MRVPNQMAWLTCVVLIGVIGLSLQQKGSLKLGVELGRVHTQDSNTPASMLCTLRDGKGKRVPLAGCEFHHKGTIWDLNQGSASPTKHHTFHDVIVHDDYFGTGLENGDCGLTITHIKTGATHAMTCRARPAAGGAWLYATTMLVVDERPPMQYRLHPSGEVVVLPGSDVTLLGSADRQVNNCHFTLPPNSNMIHLHSGTTATESSQDGTSNIANNYRAWREGKQCGITLRAVQSSWSGHVTSFVDCDSPNTTSADVTLLIVASPPETRPVLTVESAKKYFKPGDVLNATCVVGASLPVSNLSWILGKKVIRNENWNEGPAETEWMDDSKPRSIEQRLSRQLSLQDDGKALKCRAEHLALPSQKMYSNIYTIRVKVAGASDQNPCGPGSKCSVVEDVEGNPQPLREETQCGRRVVEPVLISGGKDVNRAEFPWNAGIFNDKGNSDIKHICGGTLIKPNIVISAAHCFASSTYQTLVPNTSVKVALGKLHLDWYEEMTDKEVQRFDVESIFISEDYIGSSDGYSFDIAVIRLATNAALNKYVNVACVDWGMLGNTRYKDQMKTGDIGTVAGWGKTATSETASPKLQRIDLPWVDMNTCRQNTHHKMRYLLTRNKFCAGHMNQSRSVCPGDSGGGLLFLNKTDNRYYLRGVVSTSLTHNPHQTLCSSDHYTTFTSVGEHADWIDEQLST